MYGRRRWQPSKTAKREFAQKMDEVKEFCDANSIGYSRNMDSFYFLVNGRSYRVSNHSIESSNAAAYDDVFGQTREVYHPEGREADVIYIHASKTRICEIYKDLKAGYVLDGRGRRKEA